VSGGRCASASAGIALGIAAVVAAGLPAPATLGLAAMVAGGPPAAAAAPGCARPAGVYDGAAPWPQQLLNPSSAWPLSTGAGVLVAVLGTGVDAANPQFGPGQVRAGADVTAAPRPATVDCDGRGTVAAGLIAAHADARTTFAGLAPDAGIFPVRYVQAVAGGAGTVDPDLLAAALTAAVQAKAKVICVVVPAGADSAKLRAAVGAARAADALVVSPAGAGSAATGQGTVSYPTADDGVLAVGAVDQTGAPVTTESGAYLALAAPGKGLVSTSAGTAGGVGHAFPVDDPDEAAAYVAGAAALVRAYRPDLSAAQVAARLERTASRPAVDGRDTRLGFGVVDPYAAVAFEGGDTPATTRPATGPPVAAARAPVADLSRERAAAAIAAAGVVLAALLAAGAVLARVPRVEPPDRPARDQSRLPGRPYRRAEPAGGRRLRSPAGRS
jgi:membrane-anchored mycosin MYCP